MRPFLFNARLQINVRLARFIALTILFGALVLALQAPRVHAAPLVSAPLTNWSGTANGGLFGGVFAIAMRGNNVYVGGMFNETRDGQITGFNNIARWDGAAWHLLDLGLNGPVHALAFDSKGNLFVGGDFEGNCATAGCQSTDQTLNNLARWDGSNWSRVKWGVDGPVRALLMDDSDNLFVGGEFRDVCMNKTCAVSDVFNHIAKWDGTGWHLLGNGLDNPVHALAIKSNGELYAGGRFSSICANPECLSLGPAYNIARFKNGVWSALPLKGLAQTVNALAFVGNALYVGGDFQHTSEGGGTQLQYIAKFSNETWSALPHNGLNDRVNTLAVNGSDLYIGGYFVETNDGAVTDLNHIVRFADGAWHALPNNGLDGATSALGIQNAQTLYAGGDFTATADNTVTDLYALAHVAAPQSCGGKPVKPTLKKPVDGRFSPTNTVTLKWNAAGCANTYTVVVRESATGALADKANGLTGLKYKTDPLPGGIEYQWFVKACNTIGCRKSEVRTFTVQ